MTVDIPREAPERVCRYIAYDSMSKRARPMFGQKAKEGYESTEYVRADIAEARIAELEEKLARHREDRPFVIGWNDGFEHGVKEAAGICQAGADKVSEKQRKAFAAGDDTRGQQLHSAQCACLDMRGAILALIEGATND